MRRACTAKSSRAANAPTDTLGRTCTGAHSRERVRLTPQESLALVERIAQIADDKLARDIVILDMADVVGYTDYFLIATGNTGRQTSAIAQEIAFQLKEESRLMPLRGDGKRSTGDWILLDYVDVVVHLFTPEARDFYRLEQLWGQVPARQYASA